MKKIALVLFLTSTLFLLQAKTVEEIKKEVEKYSHNIGFIASTQRETLKQQFPMCDEFLDVHWFEKKPNTLQRGWRKYTTAFDYKYDSNLAQYVKKEQDTTVYELVEIQEDGHAEYYGLYFIKRAFPDNWKEVIQDVNITGNNKQFTFHYKSKKYEVSKFKFNMADNYLNICVAKPDNQTALFYEMKRANKVLSDGEQDKFIEDMKNIGLKYKKEYLKNITLMDINNDGKMDMLNGSPWMRYSYKDIILNSDRHKLYINEYYQYTYTFPPNNKKCMVNSLKGYIYMYNNNLLYSTFKYSSKRNPTICNLTELTTQTKKGEN